MSVDNFGISGLTDAEVRQSRATHGQNRLDYQTRNSFLDALKSIAKEPMVILLLVASVHLFYNRKYRGWHFSCRSHYSRFRSFPYIKIPEAVMPSRN